MKNKTKVKVEIDEVKHSPLVTHLKYKVIKNNLIWLQEKKSKNVAHG